MEMELIIMCCIFWIYCWRKKIYCGKLEQNWVEANDYIEGYWLEELVVVILGQQSEVESRHTCFFFN
jgi:hypothetical protein